MPARQALISLLVDQRRLDDAQRLLQEALARDPDQVQFATVLARILVERDDYGRALEVLRACKGDVSRDADYNALLGAVLQHMSRPAEAADAYRAALRLAPQAGTAWVGLGLSLEALRPPPGGGRGVPARDRDRFAQLRKSGTTPSSSCGGCSSPRPGSPSVPRRSSR